MSSALRIFIENGPHAGLTTIEAATPPPRIAFALDGGGGTVDYDLAPAAPGDLERAVDARYRPRRA